MDNPADFSFFYDIGGHRRCYIAPERFYEGAAGCALGIFIGPRPTSCLLPSPDLGTKSGTDGPVSPLFLPPSGLADGDGDALSPAADIFSAGCVVAEVFLDGDALFDLGELLAYRRGEGSADPSVKLARIRDPAARELVAHMVQRDPAERLSAKSYLQRW